MEGSATTVYAQGGRGNSRLVAWEGERTVTFTMEDALISPEGFMILSGAGLVEASSSNVIKQHVTETVTPDNSGIVVEGETMKIRLSEKPYLSDTSEDFAYVMLMKDGEIVSEPYIPMHGDSNVTEETSDGVTSYVITVSANADRHTAYVLNGSFPDYDSVLVDYYTPKESGARQIEITADKFGGNYYLEASTLFRDTNGVDMAAEFIIPNCKIQSNFTFTMASSGDPSTFTFTMDAFPDYTRFDKSKKVLAAIQIVDEAGSMDLVRGSTEHETIHNQYFD